MEDTDAQINKERLDDTREMEEVLEEQRQAPTFERPPVKFEKNKKHQIETVLSYWTEYKPDWQAPTTRPAIANGILTGRYVKQGNTIIVQIKLVAASSTTFGSGQWFFTLPSPIASHGFTAVGSAYLIDSGTTKSIGVALATAGDSRVSVQTHSSANPVRSDTPWTWASGDELHVELVYETS